MVSWLFCLGRLVSKADSHAPLHLHIQLATCTWNQIHVPEHVEKEMKRLRKNILPQMPSNLIHNVPGGVKLLHINIGNFKRKIEDMKNDDIFQNTDIIALNETHLWHSDTLTPDMMGISKDMFIVHCDCKTGEGGCSYCKHKSKSQTDQNEYNFRNCCCTDKWTDSDDYNISLQAIINTNRCIYESYVIDHCTISACTNMYCRWLQWRCISYIKYPLLYNV